MCCLHNQPETLFSEPGLGPPDWHPVKWILSALMGPASRPAFMIACMKENLPFISPSVIQIANSQVAVKGPCKAGGSKASVVCQTGPLKILLLWRRRRWDLGNGIQFTLYKVSIACICCQTRASASGCCPGC